MEESQRIYIFELPTGHFVKMYAHSVYEARDKALVKYQSIESDRNNYKHVTKKK